MRKNLLRIDKTKLKKCILRTGKPATQLSTELHYASSWLGTVMYRGYINKASAEALESIGIKREEYCKGDTYASRKAEEK